ncbi:MAG: 8-amino-7-oxononanoate synthase [Rhodospirillaceae bacterium]|jgi:8-amino-7-oxononanoate synthase|nr:8-amino-7-oxononanoate synthase [Rhodospirillaceae bacterium]
MPSLDEYARAKLSSLEQRQLRRTLVETDRQDGAIAYRDGRRMVSFSCNDYLNMSHHPDVVRAATEATARYGVGSGASRLITGNHPLFRELEGRLARLKGAEDACVFGSGYLANLGIIPTLMGPEDLILADEWSHSCILAGGAISKARQFVFRHNDVDHVEELLAEHRAAHPRALIVTDGVFSMDGDMAPVPALADVADKYDAWLMTDDAHGVGVIGGGRGSTHATGAQGRVPLQMGTLSKAIGGYGGYLCAAEPVIDLMRTRSRTFIYSTGLPPAAAAAAIAAIDVIERDPEYVALPMAKAGLFAELVGLPAPESCIVPIVLGDPARTLAASKMLEDEGYIVTAIRPPTVPDGTARLRFTFTAGHEDSDVRRLAEIVLDRVLA